VKIKIKKPSIKVFMFPLLIGFSSLDFLQASMYSFTECGTIILAILRRKSDSPHTAFFLAYKKE